MVRIIKRPDHDTICTFRRRFLESIGDLFTQILLIAAEMDMVELGNVSIDGTKINANASKHKAMNWQRACGLEDQLSEEVAKLLVRASRRMPSRLKPNCCQRSCSDASSDWPTYGGGQADITHKM